MTPAEITAIANAVYAKILNTDGEIASPTAATSPNKFWAWKSHIVYGSQLAHSTAAIVASMLTRLVALGTEVAGLRADVKSLQAGGIHVTPTSVPVTGSLTIGGAQ